MKASPEAISGYSLALSSLLGGCGQCPLGIPHGKGGQLYTVAEELLRLAPHASRLAQVKTQAGWILLSSVISLGRYDRLVGTFKDRIVLKRCGL